MHGLQVDEGIENYTLGDRDAVGGEHGLLAICLLGIVQIPCSTELLIGDAGRQRPLSDAASSGIFKTE